MNRYDSIQTNTTEDVSQLQAQLEIAPIDLAAHISADIGPLTSKFGGKNDPEVICTLEDRDVGPI